MCYIYIFFLLQSNIVITMEVHFSPKGCMAWLILAASAPQAVLQWNLLPCDTIVSQKPMGV